MLEQTVFENNEEIVEYLKNNYDLEITNVTKIERGSANIYSLNNIGCAFNVFDEEGFSWDK